MNHLEMFKVNALKDSKVVLIFKIESPNFYLFIANKKFDTFVSDCIAIGRIVRPQNHEN